MALPSVRAAPSATFRRVIPERALELVVPESAPARAVLAGVAVVQCREKHCNQVLPVMRKGRQEGEIVRPSRSLNDDAFCSHLGDTGTALAVRYLLEHPYSLRFHQCRSSE